MTNKTAVAAQAGPRKVKIDMVSATVVDGAIVTAGAKDVEVSEAAARELLSRGKAILSTGQELDMTGPLSFGMLPTDADGDGILDSLQAAEGDTGKGGPPTAEGDPGSARFDPTEPPAGAVSTVSSATLAVAGLTPEEQAEAENRKREAQEAEAKRKEAEVAKAKAEAEKATTASAAKATARKPAAGK